MKRKQFRQTFGRHVEDKPGWQGRRRDPPGGGQGLHEGCVGDFGGGDVTDGEQRVVPFVRVPRLTIINSFSMEDSIDTHAVAAPNWMSAIPTATAIASSKLFPVAVKDTEAFSW